MKRGIIIVVGIVVLLGIFEYKTSFFSDLGLSLVYREMSIAGNKQCNDEYWNGVVIPIPGSDNKVTVHSYYGGSGGCRISTKGDDQLVYAKQYVVIDESDGGQIVFSPFVVGQCPASDDVCWVTSRAGHAGLFTKEGDGPMRYLESLPIEGFHSVRDIRKESDGTVLLSFWKKGEPPQSAYASFSVTDGKLSLRTINP